MKNFGKFLRKWSFLLMWGICGFIFLGFLDKQNVYGGIFPEWKNQDERQGTDRNGETREGDADGRQDAGGEQKNRLKDGDNEGGNMDPDGALKEEDAANGKTDAEAGEENSEKTGLDMNTAGGNAKTFQGYMTVEDDYFADAVFIGDSRTVGLWEYGGLEEISTFYASKGLTIFTLPDAKIINVEGQREKITVYDALSEADFKKIYLMVGINELGTGDVERFVNAYREVLERFHELQPEAVIYIQAIMKVTTKRSNQGDYITNEGIEERNEGIRALADNVTYFYLDANPAVCDETGGMKEEYTTDGVHLKGKDIHIWKDFLKEHAVRLD